MSPEDGGSSRSTERSFTDNTRRRFLLGTGALGALTASGVYTSPVLAGDDDDSTETPTSTGTPTGTPEDEFEDIVAILNYARTLEALEYRFYERALNNISEDDLVSGPLKEFGDPVTENVYDYLGVIRDHEQTHFETLGDVITDLGGDPVSEPKFDFGTAVEDPEEFIATAVALEDTGVAAYAGAVPNIANKNEELLPPAASIHSVEARHASYLRVLDMQIPFPEAFDEALSRSQVLEIASQFIVEE